MPVTRLNRQERIERFKNTIKAIHKMCYSNNKKTRLFRCYHLAKAVEGNLSSHYLATNVIPRLIENDVVSKYRKGCRSWIYRTEWNPSELNEVLDRVAGMVTR